MMERSKQKKIMRKLNSIKYNLIRHEVYLRDSDAKKNDSLLTEIVDECKYDFPSDRSAYYVEIIQEMKTTLQVLCNQNVKKYVFQDIKKLLLELIDYTILDLQKEKIKKEVYFLPYKLDMWDSLESIWKELSADKEFFNTYVMPIPWAERNPNGSVKKWHCEINDFSKYVPVIDYRKVNLAVIKPDVIFIHNPYDGNNLVTSVDERYYSIELKKYTDILIYVPYFVVGDSINPDKCHSPAIRYADYVIVQDEKIKKVYEENYLWGDPKGKFLPLGSPKFDKVLSSNETDYVLPMSWQRKIAGKKVILYNTSIRDMMFYDEKYIDKLNSVFKYFKNNYDVVLWWRPHPLLKTSMNIVRAELYGIYCNLEKKYREENWGIFDDTFDVHRAIAYTDAYYGDRSSLVWMYNKTGKPVMQQNYNRLEYPDNYGISAYFFTSNGENSWLIHYIQNTPYLWEVDNGTGEAKMLIKLPVTDYRYKNYGPIAYYKGNIFIFPWRGEGRIMPLEYNIDKNELSVITLDIPLPKSSNAFRFIEDVVENRSSIFFVGNDNNTLVEYEKEKNNWKVIEMDWENRLIEIATGNDKEIFLLSQNNIGIIDISSNKTRWQKISDFSGGWRMSLINDKLWILGLSKYEIVSFDVKERKLYRGELPRFKGKENMFYTFVPYHNTVMILSGYVNFSKILLIDENKIKIRDSQFTVGMDLKKQNFTLELFSAVAIKHLNWFALSGDGKILFSHYNGKDYLTIIKYSRSDFEKEIKELKKTFSRYRFLDDELEQLISVVGGDNDRYEKGFDDVFCSKSVKKFLYNLE